MEPDLCMIFGFVKLVRTPVFPLFLEGKSRVSLRGGKAPSEKPRFTNLGLGIGLGLRAGLIG